MARMPELVDTLAVVAQEKGPEFFLAWADMMTGEASWSKMLQPQMAVPLTAELGRQIWEKRGASLWGNLFPGDSSASPWRRSWSKANAESAPSSTPARDTQAAAPATTTCTTRVAIWY